MTQAETVHNDSAGRLYQPLAQDQKEIRLLKLRAGVRSAPVECVLSTVSLLDIPKPVYETISYCWGDESVRDTISVNGRELDVPSSAKNALLRMRDALQERILWIDAICIDQQNFDERAQQVSIMGDVYFQGQRCLVYLGEDEGIAHEVFKGIHIVLDDAREMTEDFTNWQDFIARDKMETRSQTPPSCKPDWEVLEKFYGRPWFRRLWVVQEIVLSPEGTCYYGDVKIPLLDVLRVATWMAHYIYFMPGALKNLSVLGPITDMADHKLGWSIRKAEKAATLPYLLNLARHYETTDPRDKVYATLGLTEWRLRWKELPSALVPDYRKSLREILRDVTRFCIQTRQELDLYSGINFGWDDETTGTITPSWVPRWDQLKDRDHHVYHLADFFKAHDNMRVWLDHDDNEPAEGANEHSSNVLPFVGLCIDTVTATSCVFDDSNNDGFDLTNAVEFYNDIKGLVGDLATVARALIASCNWYGDNATSDDLEGLSAYLEFIATYHGHPRGPPGMPAGWPEWKMAASRYFNALWTACLNRRFFVTKDGRHGLGPSGMIEGDTVAILYGGRWPFILRPVEDGYYRMIGICYVEGIMFGEAVQENEAKGRDDHLFPII